MIICSRQDLGVARIHFAALNLISSSRGEISFTQLAYMSSSLEMPRRMRALVPVGNESVLFHAPQYLVCAAILSTEIWGMKLQPLGSIN